MLTALAFRISLGSREACGHSMTRGSLRKLANVTAQPRRTPSIFTRQQESVSRRAQNLATQIKSINVVNNDKGKRKNT